MNKFILSLAIVFGVLLIVASCQSPKPGDFVQRVGHPDIYIADHDNIAMHRTIQEAQETFDEFVVLLNSGRTELKHFSVKVGFPITPGKDEKEHIWLYEVSVSGDEITGKIGNDPLYVKYLNLDEEVTMDRDDISDWMVVDNNGRLYGGYSLRLIREQMSEDEKKRFDQSMGLVFEEE